ncbi:hypothetical protein SELMODRAFT_448468 [Selaginella moellendorffii]|uniref:Rhodanese domain-containing protein n=1 Tax=Selaginella moellendorffii TaxID=88036 RepID=D8T7K0_SELML|nr:rhodanese-like domain-containing protein 4, chloroplastic [Selaginella moellendorffii]EFJ07356.1 hypothetical protein SELMODRAFT_448468 [Selaginella moellendorffii]|eukprot:XP_002991602.1 rhodanese-like domain-containing protein 4, chloroplastic [Selaginella moellendorffii]
MEMVRDLTASLLPPWTSKPSLPAAAELRLPPLSIHRRIAQVSQHAALALIGSGISTGIASALPEYDEIIQRAAGAATPIDAASAISPADGIDFSVAESVLGFVSDNPAAVAGGLLAIALPVLISRLAGGKQPWGVVSAKEAYEKLAVKDPAFQILDIREPSDIKAEGTPDLRQFKKRVLQVSFSQEQDAFVAKVKSKFKDPASTTLYILDRFDGNSLAVAKLLATNGFKEAYGIKDGAEGGRGWQQSELPWLLPRKGLSLNLDALKEAIQFESDLVPATLGVAAAAGVGLVVFSEAETALQLVGTVALLQLFAKKFLFAEDRKKTLQQIKTFLDTKVAPKELVEEIQGVGKALLPKFEEVSAGNGAVVSSEPASVNEEKVVEASPPSPAPIVAAKEEETPAPSSQSSEEKKPSRPSSPYILYPDLKPPSSPTPSRPEK